MSKQNRKIKQTKKDTLTDQTVKKNRLDGLITFDGPDAVEERIDMLKSFEKEFGPQEYQ